MLYLNIIKRDIKQRRVDNEYIIHYAIDMDMCEIMHVYTYFVNLNEICFSS